MTARFGVPSQMVCKNVRAFTAQLFEDLCFQVGIHLTDSIPYPTAFNAIVERTFHTLKLGL